MNDNIYASASKRLPIVFCLDVSPSMNGRVSGSRFSRIELLNTAMLNFLKELKNDTKVRTSAEISFVTFSTNIEMDSDFESVNSIKIPTFQTVAEGGTNMAQAIIRSIAKIESRREELDDAEIGYYVPFFVLLTDGNPDKNDNTSLLEKAIVKVQQYCDSHVGASEIIIPFIIGVGDEVEVSTLNRLSERFTGKAILIDSSVGNQDKIFEDVFKFIGNSVIGSIHLNDTPKEIFTSVRIASEKLEEKIEQKKKEFNLL